MGAVKIVFFREGDEVPALKWFEEIPQKAQEKGEVKLERLAELGHELRRPEADYLGDDIYELRWRFQSVNYRLLYFFHGREAVVISHGLMKEVEIPPREIDLAISRKMKFESNPDRYKYEEED